MKRILSIFTLVLVLAFCLCGCTNKPDSAGGSDKSADGSTQQVSENADDQGSKDASADQKKTGDQSGTDAKTKADQTKTDDAAAQQTSEKNSSSSTSSRLDPNIAPETQEFMNNITGTWEQSTPLEDGNANIVRVKIDNVSGFTFTTGTQTPDGTGSFYSRVGSYEIEGNKIIFSGTTGGESNDGSSYNLRQDFGVFEYTISENPELTQIVLTPANDRAILLTGEAPITLNKV